MPFGPWRAVHKGNITCVFRADTSENHASVSQFQVDTPSSQEGNCD